MTSTKGRKARIFRGLDTCGKSAVRRAVIKWCRIVEGKRADHGRDDCPLCGLYFKGYPKCARCPVREFAGETGCVSTPHEPFVQHVLGDPPQGVRPVSALGFLLAQAELLFLAEFLPWADAGWKRVRLALARKWKGKK